MTADFCPGCDSNNRSLRKNYCLNSWHNEDPNYCPWCQSGSKELRLFTQTGPYTVSDKRCGHKWHDAPAPSQGVTVTGELQIEVINCHLEPAPTNKPASLDQAERILKDIRLLRDAYEPGEIRSALNAAADRMDVAASHIYRNAPQPEPAPAQGVTVTGDLPIEVIDCRVGTAPTKPAEPVSATPRTDAFPTRSLERLISEAKNRKGMVVGMPHITAPCEHVEYILARSRHIENELAKSESRAAELQKAMEALRDDMLNKVMAATDVQIEAAIRMEGRDPKDVAALTRQTLTNALHTVEMNKLQTKLAAETARADGAHNAAIDAVISRLRAAVTLLYEREVVDALLALKVPQ